MHTNETDRQLLERSQDEFQRYCTLPLPVFILAEDGRLLRCNTEATAFFSNGNDVVEHRNIWTFALNKSEVRRIGRRIKNMADEEWDKNETIVFRSDGAAKSTRLTIKVYRNEEKLLGKLCLAFEISELERFKDLGSMMPIGVFEVNHDRKISYANPKFLEILGYQQSDVEKIAIDDILQESSELQEIISTLSEGKTIDNQMISLKCKDGSLKRGNISIVPNLDEEDEKLWGSNGVLEDATYYEISEMLTIPMYMVSSVSGEERIIAANKAFAMFNGVSSVEDCKVPIRNFWPDTALLDDLIREIENKFKINQPLLGFNTSITNLQGERRNVILNVSPLYSGKKVVGRVGSIIDITNDINRAVIDIQQDIGSFLHTYSAVLVTIRANLLSTIVAHGVSVADENGKVDVNKALVKILEHANGLKSKMVILSAKNAELNIIEEQGMSFIYRQIEKLLRSIQEVQGAKMQVAWIRQTAIKLRGELMKYTKATFPREMYRGILFDVTEILRFSSMIAMSIALEEIRKMQNEMETFRDTLFLRGVNEEPFTNVRIKPLMDEVVSSLLEDASIRDVEVKMYDLSDKYLVEGSERELNIAFRNVVHNAIKYSWRKPGEDNKTVVKITFSSPSKKELAIQIENRGVPIRKEELGNKIFSYGYRGRQSHERERPGSGVGLWHTRKIIHNHKGSIEIKSGPIMGYADNDYSAPFITTVTILLPLIN